MRGGEDTADAPTPWRPPPLGDADRDGDDFTPMTPGEPAAGADPDQARRVIENARGRADELLDEAREEAEQIRREAREELLEQVREQLEEALRETVDEQVQAFERARDDLLGQIRDQARERDERLEREIAGLVCTMAEKVIHRKIGVEDDIVREVVRTTIEQAAGAERFTVRVAPAEEETVRKAQAELLSAADGAVDFEIVADEAVGPGGCVVETERGRFDARISTQVELLDDEMRRVLGEQS
jgi:flagellar biosynthesis/type III secretory pathway protein FliH